MNVARRITINFVFTNCSIVVRKYIKSDIHTLYLVNTNDWLDISMLLQNMSRFPFFTTHTFFSVQFNFNPFLRTSNCLLQTVIICCITNERAVEDLICRCFSETATNNKQVLPYLIIRSRRAINKKQKHRRN